MVPVLIGEIDCGDDQQADPDHKPGGIAAPIVMHIGSLQANLALRYLAELTVTKDKLYYLYFNDEGELITQKFGMPKV
jgi:adenylyltransferase/sulfurtransferase